MEKSDAAKFAELFKALGDETRVRILLMLNARSRPVNEIVDFFNLAQPTISRHLAALKHCGLVTAKRRGQQVIYGISEEGLRDKTLAFFAEFDCCKGLNPSQLGKKR